MKLIKQLILIPLLLLVLLLFTPSIKAYEQEQLTDCISSAKENEAIKGVSEKSIESYCNCALDLIVDQSKNVQKSGYECALKSFR